MTAVLRVEGLRAGYGAVRVLHGLSFRIEEGSITVLLGSNGAGKTTTLRALSGLLPFDGTVEFLGASIRGTSADRLNRLGIAHVPEGRGTFANLTVEDNLRVGSFGGDKRELPALMEQCYGVFPRLEERRKQQAGSLSGGEQQMLAIARALISKPKLLLLDEPSLGLAPLTTEGVFDALARINQDLGLTILLVEQNANLALRIATGGLVLSSGVAIVTGTPEELAARDDVRRAYLGA